MSHPLCKEASHEELSEAPTMMCNIRIQCRHISDPVTKTENQLEDYDCAHWPLMGIICLGPLAFGFSKFFLLSIHLDFLWIGLTT